MEREKNVGGGFLFVNKLGSRASLKDFEDEILERVARD